MRHWRCLSSVSTLAATGLHDVWNLAATAFHDRWNRGGAWGGVEAWGGAKALRGVCIINIYLGSRRFTWIYKWNGLGVSTVGIYHASCRFPWSDRWNGGGDVFVVVVVMLSIPSVLNLAPAGLCGPTDKTGVETFRCCCFWGAQHCQFSPWLLQVCGCQEREQG